MTRGRAGTSAMEHDGEIDRSEFDVPRMDCPSEERMLRMALEGVATIQAMQDWLRPLGLGAQLISTRCEHRAIPSAAAHAATDHGERRTLYILLAINGGVFFAEGFAGWRFQSTGLLADSLDMLADATVYGVSLYVVGRQTPTGCAPPTRVATCS